MTPGPGPDSDPRVFATTRWTLVLRARGEGPEGRAALSELCAAYWMPVYRFLRRDGRSEDEARELAQEFFARVLAGPGLGTADPERGRFRSYLLGAVKHFLSDERGRAGRQKRGGGMVHESMDQEPAGGDGGVDPRPVREWEDPDAAVMDEVFDREWAVAVMGRALAVVEREMGEAGKADQYRWLRGWLAGEASVRSQAEVASELGMSEGAVKVAIHRLRRRFREAIRAELEQTLPCGADPDEELRYLAAVLRRPGREAG